MKPTLEIINADCREGLKTLERRSVQCMVTSPPYWGLRDYDHREQIGLEETPQEYAKQLLLVFREIRRVLRVDGTAWLNIGDTYAGQMGWSLNDQTDTKVFNRGNGDRAALAHVKPKRDFKMPLGLKPKDLVGVPWRVALALQADDWYLRCDIIWYKPSTMPGPMTDRPTRNHEYIFLFSKSGRYFYNADAVKVRSVNPGKVTGRASAERESNVNTLKHPWQDGEYRNRRSVWRISNTKFMDCHFACFPEGLPRLCILAGSRAGDTVLDPFAGSGTTAKVALELGRHAVMIESNPDYLKFIRRRCETWKMKRIGEMRWETKHDWAGPLPDANDTRLNIPISSWGTSLRGA